MGVIPIWDGKVPHQLQAVTFIWALGLFITRITGVLWLFNMRAYGGAVVLIILGIGYYKNRK